MGLKAVAAKWFASVVVRKQYREAADAVRLQEKTLLSLVKQAAGTAFGKDHDFAGITNYEAFKQRVPVRDYEQLRVYADRMISGEPDVLWPGVPFYLSKTSGTTSGTKYIPISKESMPHHITAARNALLSYVYHSGNTDFVNHKMIFLQGSPLLDNSHAIPTGRLSGIVANYVPAYLQRNRLPSFATNCIEDWETKVDKIVDETIVQDMSLISGIPSWVQMYYEKLVEKAGKPVGEIFPDFSLFVFGGVNFEPYRRRFYELVGREIDTIETYPASEGFIAFQDDPGRDDLLLNINAGIFFEFVPVGEMDNEHPARLSVAEVKTGENYAILLSTNAGLWAYNIGDTVRFTSLEPLRIKVTGRIKHYTSAFGEHVIAEEVEEAMKQAIERSGALVSEFTLAPQITPENGLPYHEWFVEFVREPSDWELFVTTLDETLQKKNTYYKDLIKGHVLRKLVIRVIPQGSFVEYMKSQGKLGGQNKIPRLQNNRNIADFFSSRVSRSII
ncbi:MAG: GH3 auxin-responsive promoter family protein [Bacteroidota bacterium]